MERCRQGGVEGGGRADRREWGGRLLRHREAACYYCSNRYYCCACTMTGIQPCTTASSTRELQPSPGKARQNTCQKRVGERPLGQKHATQGRRITLRGAG